MKKKYILLFLAIVLFSCGKAKKENIIGKWQALGVKIPMTFTFKSDSTLMTSLGEKTLSYNWKIEKDSLIILQDGLPKQSFVISFLNEDEMQWSSIGDDKSKNKFTMKRKK